MTIDSKQFYGVGLNLLKFAVGLACVRILFDLQGLTAIALMFGLGGTLMTVMHLKKIYYKALNASTLALTRSEEMRDERLQDTGA